ncbi:MAG: type VI secretion system baseplate subunit TssK [Spirochaetaceae bacterium]|jgi:type VI secretion system ImpJ/VasE family protein|nr:type VI secretion system baseplate subunit TssK [Spirochaetaceae bacterium]
MRFEEFPHWNDGQFLQPHHFQYQQRITADFWRLNRRFYMQYPYGLLDFEVDYEALDEAYVSLKRFSAVMGNGLEVSMPGNCIVKPLDLSAALKNNPAKLTVYAAVPAWSELESNLADDDHAMEKKLYLTQKKRVRDENTGDNEIALITRKLNVRMVTDLDDNKDMQLLPLLKLNVASREMTRHIVKLDESYIPPFMMLTTDDPLFNMTTSLITDIRRCRDKLQSNVNALSSSFTLPAESGDEAATYSGVLNEVRATFLMRAVSVYYVRLYALVVDGFITPFELYLELSSFLAELMSVNPYNGVRNITHYNHDDRMPVFTELFKDIRSFIRSEGGAGYVRLNFTRTDAGGLFTNIKSEDISEDSELYLTVKTDADPAAAIRALEQGDTFRLINPQAKHLRIRGVKLSEMRYPPRFLPVMDWTLWFKLDIVESARVWRAMCEEKGMVIDYAEELFPGLEASLFITIMK